MDFAPYQSQSPETTRTLSPTRVTLAHNRSFSPGTSPKSDHRPSRNHDSNNQPRPPTTTTSNGLAQQEAAVPGTFEERQLINEFETSLPLRMDYEAMLAYFLLPPAGAVLLLLVETRSDYVRSVSSKPPIHLSSFLHWMICWYYWGFGILLLCIFNG